MYDFVIKIFWEICYFLVDFCFIFKLCLCDQWELSENFTIEISDYCLHARYCVEYYILKQPLRLPLILKMPLFFSHYKSSRGVLQKCCIEKFRKIHRKYTWNQSVFFHRTDLSASVFLGIVIFNTSARLLLSDFSANNESDYSLKSYYKKWDNSETQKNPWDCVLWFIRNPAVIKAIPIRQDSIEESSAYIWK